MFVRRLWVAIGATVAPLIGPLGRMRQRAVAISVAGAACLMAIVLTGASCAQAPGEHSQGRGSAAELAQAGGGAVSTAPAESTTPARRRWRRRQDAGDLIAEAIVPTDEMIRENGLAFRSSHFAEDCQDWAADGYPYYQGHASRFVFAIEATGGICNEYSLCAAEGPDGQYGLYVSVCEYRFVTEQREGKDGKARPYHRVVIDRVYLVKPDTLSLALRAQILDELSQGNFMGAYRRYVREHQAGEAVEPVSRPWLQAGGE